VGDGNQHVPAMVGLHVQKDWNSYCREDEIRETTTARSRTTPHRQRSEATCAHEENHQPDPTSFAGPVFRDNEESAEPSSGISLCSFGIAWIAKLGGVFDAVEGDGGVGEAGFTFSASLD